MPRRFSGLSKSDLVNFLFDHCQSDASLLHVTKIMLRKIDILDLDKARYAIIHDKRPRLFGRLASLASGIDKRQRAIESIWQFCLQNGFDQYFGRDALEAQNDQSLWTASSAIKHDSFPRLVNWLLQQHRQQTH